MKVPRTLAAAALVAGAWAQSASITAPPSTSSKAPGDSNAITTSVLWAADGPFQSVPGVDLPSDDITLVGSIVTVNPSGTVVHIDCPYPKTAANADDVCSFFSSLSYTLKPSYEAIHIDFSLSTRLYGVGASIGGIGDSVCTSTNTQSLNCAATMTARVSAEGTKTESVTSSTFTLADPTYTALTITGGLDKTRAVPQGTQPTGAAGSLRARTLFGAAGAVAAAALAL
ncbi:uncharacterized protein EI97DRAFT_430324 [Westerdykella ornata]|uniref:Uncharacterized protein n=1 Tax=Westerdykella ornata TaxID=318751 RepID=A0A6A6JS59_WESOR|nr:uncharacterized protein EI97DRAFT_430324 [Westerdykella ornata]KAF2279227.1 hypothetical protein EI97DRAFT_430324 [Westerdykella ornata]